MNLEYFGFLKLQTWTNGFVTQRFDLELSLTYGNVLCAMVLVEDRQSLVMVSMATL